MFGDVVVFSPGFRRSILRFSVALDPRHPSTVTCSRKSSSTQHRPNPHSTLHPCVSAACPIRGCHSIYRTSMTLLKELHPHTPPKLYTPAGVFYTRLLLLLLILFWVFSMARLRCSQGLSLGCLGRVCLPQASLGSALSPFTLIFASSKASVIHFIGDLPKSYTSHKSPRNFS